MKHQVCRTLKLMAFAILVVAITAHGQSPLAAAPGSSGTFVTFDVPGAGTHGNQGTIPRSMNPKGTATGYYIDNSYVYHGFSIGIDGTTATFDVIGSSSTLAYDVGPDGTIVGWYYDQNNAGHGFIRDPGGAIQPIVNTPLDSINASGETGGFQFDSNGAAHAYVRSPDGTLTPFDVPGAGSANGQGTFLCPGCLNDAGDATGHYIDSNNVPHGFIRWGKDGTFATFFDQPGEAAWSSRINNNGWTCGWSFDANNAAHGFIRKSDGSIVPFDAPGAGTGSGQGTLCASINNLGVVLGEYIDSANVYHGFVRSAGGTFKILDAPGAGTRRGDGTQVAENNDAGLVSGSYIDNNLVYHGYYWVSFLP